jgi:glutamine amidotransferase
LSPAASLAVLDYGMGNLRSVEKGFERAGGGCELTSDHDRIAAAERGQPILGICLGLQLLFESSVELGGADGLGLLDGDVVEIPAGGRKVPHIGWAAVTWTRPSRLTDGLRPGEPFYFVHSYVVEPAPDDLVGTASYGGDFACVAERDHIYGVQFHPEKSSSAGLRLLENFVGICAEAAR